MPQKKKRQLFHGIHYALNYHPEVGKFARERPGVFMGREEFRILITAAVEPFRFNLIRSERNFIESFGKIYARQPDDVLEFLCLVRKILKKWDKTQAGQVLKFLHTTGRTLSVENREKAYNKDGKCIAVIVKNILNDSEKRITVANLSEAGILNLLLPQFIETDSLQDKELATLLKVKVESVKKARQQIARTDREIEFWENPAMVNYMKTGIITPEVQALWNSKSKGKK